MSGQDRAGVIIRQSYAAFWKEWIILAIAMLVIVQPGMIVAFIESKAGSGIFDGIPATRLMQGVGLIGVVYSLIYKIGYDLLANRYLLDSEEVVEIYGVIQKNRRVTKLEHIRRVSVEIGFVGRILGYGDVLYFTAGSAGADVRLKSIPNPEALAAEADALAQEKQARMRQGGRRSTPSTAFGSDADSDADQLLENSEASAQLLVAFTESVTESVAVQREILDAIRELRAETRRSASTLHSFLSVSSTRAPVELEGANGFEGVGAEHEDLAPEFEAEFDLESGPDADDSALHSVFDEGDPESAGDADDGDPYASTPKMFGDWEDTLAPSEPVVRAELQQEAAVGRVEPEPELTRDITEYESDSEVEPKQAEPKRTEDDSSLPSSAGDEEFVGLLSPKRK